MPANSILYSKYKVINELKQISIDDKRISKELQDIIYKELFLKTKASTITESMLKLFLKQSTLSSMYVDPNIKGYSSEKKFANNMKSYVDFFGEDGIFKDTIYDEDDAEEIIEWITVFEDKNILERKVRSKYNNLSDKAIKSILSKRYKGWSNLSKLLLTNRYYIDKRLGTKKSILDLMEETSENFMQIINNKEYKFQKMIDEFNKIDDTKKISYNTVEKLVASPSTKRGIWQALKVVEELVNYIGYEPTNVSIEMAREEGEKKRKDSRKEYLSKIYQECKQDIDNYEKLKEQLKETDEKQFSDQKLFLYFIQEGKSLYSGTALNIEDLETYEIDHIIPQTLIKDDSFDNKALVLRSENQEKAASFILPEKYRLKNRLWWEKLKKNNLLSSKKFYNLTRNSYSNEDIEGFINRQLVETRQITKHVANIINSFYKDTNVVYLNADLSHNYRAKYEIYKYRDLNDYHHAHDAYLAAILGLYKINYFKEVDFEELKQQSQKYYKNKEYNKMRFGYFINSMQNDIYNKDTGEIKLVADTLNKTIEETLYQNDILVSKKTEIKTGGFYNQTKNKKGLSGVNLKDNLPSEKYGSYTSLNPSYAIVVRYSKKGKLLQKMIGIPIYIDAKGQAHPEEKHKYIKQILDLKENDSFEIIKDKIPFFTTIDWDGQICSLVGATDRVEVCNAKEFNIDKGNLKKWNYSLNKLLNNKKIPVINGCLVIDDDAYQNQLDEIIKYIINKIEKEYKLYNNLVHDMKKMFLEEKLTLSQKENGIKELLKLLKCNSKAANLKTINSKLSMAFGKKNDRTVEHAIIINKSITGIKSNKNEF